MDAIRTSAKLIDAKNDLVHIITELRRENSALNKKLSESEDETKRLVVNYSKEIKKKDAKIQQLEKDHCLFKDSSKNRLESAKSNFEQKELRYERELGTALRKCKRLENIEHLIEKENQELQQLRHSNHEANEKIKSLETKLQNIGEEHERDTKEITRNNLISKSKLMKAIEKEVADIRTKALVEAREDFEGGVLNIIENNKKMAFELKHKINMLEDLQRDKNQIEMILFKTKQNFKLSKDKEIEYINQIQCHCKEQTMLKKEMKKLQREIDKYKQQTEQEKMGHSASPNIDESTMGRKDVRNLESMLHKKNLELARIKSMAKQLLDQRSECEQLLCDSIAHVKKMIINEKRRAKTKTALVDMKVSNLIEKVFSKNIA